MKAWQVSEWGEPEQMKLVDIPVPEPKSGEVRIRIHATALNFFDILQIQGKYQIKPDKLLGTAFGCALFISSEISL